MCNRFEEDTLVLEYIQDLVPLPETSPIIAAPLPLPPPLRLPSPLALPLPLPVANQVAIPADVSIPSVQPLFTPIVSNENSLDDIKPIIVAEEIIIAPPEPKVELPPVFFPLGMKQNTWDSSETKKHVEAFISS